MLQQLQQYLRANVKCLVAVAHPDDEVIWMGGLILRYPGWEWHILSLCRADDADRAPRFYRAAGALNAKGYISDLDDSPDLAPLSPYLDEIKTRIANIVPRQFDLIFTHGLNGEYTHHLRHEQVHQAVREMINSDDLIGLAMFFAYNDNKGNCIPHPDENAEIKINLSPEEYAAKLQIVRDIYGFKEGSFEFCASGSTEAFHIYSEGKSMMYRRGRSSVEENPCEY
jgi:LmbE family N-acetylglucosaminyl deacetylase